MPSTVTATKDSGRVADPPGWAPASSEQPEDARDHQDGEQAHRQFDHAPDGRDRVFITALTARGPAASQLSRFQDQWAELTAEDRDWVAHWLTELRVDARLEAPAPTALGGRTGRSGAVA